VRDVIPETRSHDEDGSAPPQPPQTPPLHSVLPSSIVGDTIAYARVAAASSAGFAWTVCEELLKLENTVMHTP